MDSASDPAGGTPALNDALRPLSAGDELEEDMVKVIALVHSVPAGSSPTVATLVEKLKSTWLPGGRPDEVLRGLVVSEVHKPFDEGSDLVAMIELWREELAGDQEGWGHILPGEVAGAPIDMWVAREHVFKAPVERESGDVSPDVIKLAGTAFRRDDFTREAFFEYWRDVHAPISGSVPGVGGYVVSEVVERLAGESSADAVLELWYADEETFNRTGDAPQQAAAWEDVPRYAKPIGEFWLMREHILLAPQPTGPGVLEVTNA